MIFWLYAAFTIQKGIAKAPKTAWRIAKFANSFS
jgi:hypothetical protein